MGILAALRHSLVDLVLPLASTPSTSLSMSLSYVYSSVASISRHWYRLICSLRA